jgi:hypothetical protein
MGDTQQLEQVLLALNDPNDVARQNAEAFLAEWKKQPDLAVTSFVTLLRTSQVEQVCLNWIGRHGLRAATHSHDTYRACFRPAKRPPSSCGG